MFYFKDIYKAPFHIDGCYIKSSDNVKCFNVLTDDEELKARIVSLLNEEDGAFPLKNVGLSSDKKYIVSEQNPILMTRGWGYLTGSGSLDLPAEDAAKIQDNFTQWAASRIGGYKFGIEKNSAINRQKYDFYELTDYPDIINVKVNKFKEDVICFKNFGHAYIEVLKEPSEEDETVKYVRLEKFSKIFGKEIGKLIDRLKEDERIMYRDFPHAFDKASASKIIEGLYIAIGTMYELVDKNKY